MVTAGSQYYAPLAEIDFEAARRNLDEHLLLPLQIGRDAAGRVRPGGTLIFMTGTGARRRGPGMAIAGIASAAVPAIAANLAVEIAPVRVNLIAAGSSTRRCPPGCWAMISKDGAASSAPRCPSGGWSGRTTWPRWPYTS